MRPIRTETLLLTSIVALILLLAAILAGFTAYVTHRTRQLEREAELALLESVRQEVGTAYASLEELLASRRETLRQAHEQALTYFRREGRNAPLEPLRDRLAETTELPVDISIIDRDLVVARSTHAPNLGLDLKRPAFVDARMMLGRASADNDILISSPRLEIVSGEFRLHTYSALADGFSLEVSFVSPTLNDFFEAAQQQLSSRGAYDAELFFLMWDELLLSLREDTPAATSDKAQAVDAGGANRAGELEWFRRAASTDQAVRRHLPEADKPVYYLRLVNLATPGAPAVEVLTRVTMRFDLGQPIRQTLFSAMGVTAALMLTALLLIYLLLRRGLVRPIRTAITAIDRWEPIALDRSGRAIVELQLLASRYNTMLENAETRIQGLDKLATTDSLTGLANRARLETEVEVELRTARRYDQPCALIMIDIDHFKRINDRHGHLAGDEVLRTLAAILREGVRESDTVGRWGGEEFLVLCRRTELDAAIFLATTLNRLVAVHSFGRVASCTASFGVAASAPEDTMETLFSRADAALYDAKQAGRNRVVAGESPAGEG